MNHIPIIAFDFSMNKPAMCSLINNKLDFYAWPTKLDIPSQTKLQNCGVNVYVRNLEAMHDKDFNESELICEHVNRASNLADMIIKSIKGILNDNDITDYAQVIIANEGFSFGSKGDASLDLSGYKYILMYKLYENGFRTFKTYSPITLKATAGCSKKSMRSKENMISMLGKEDHSLHTFIDVVGSLPELLIKKTNFIMCVDDLADAYWCMKTVVKKEKIKCVIQVNEH